MLKNNYHIRRIFINHGAFRNCFLKKRLLFINLLWFLIKCTSRCRPPNLFLWYWKARNMLPTYFRINIFIKLELGLIEMLIIIKVFVIFILVLSKSLYRISIIILILPTTPKLHAWFKAYALSFHFTCNNKIDYLYLLNARNIQGFFQLLNLAFLNNFQE